MTISLEQRVATLEAQVGAMARGKVPEGLLVDDYDVQSLGELKHRLRRTAQILRDEIGGMVGDNATLLAQETVRQLRLLRFERDKLASPLSDTQDRIAELEKESKQHYAAYRSERAEAWNFRSQRDAVVTQVDKLKERIAELEEAYRAESIKAHDAEVQRDALRAERDSLRENEAQETAAILALRERWGISPGATFAAGVEALLARAGKDIAFLLPRANMAGSWGSADGARSTGCSANALVRWALGGERPTENERPFDLDDLRACQLAVAQLPPHRRRPEVMALLGVYEGRFPMQEVQ